jgi:hypothetical protein
MKQSAITNIAKTATMRISEDISGAKMKMKDGA